MKPWPSAGLGIFLALAAPAAAQPVPGDDAALAAALAEIVSIASFGTVSPSAQAAGSVRDGDSYRLTLPLTGLQAPDDAAVTANARPAGNGLWDVGSIRFPANGVTVPNGTPQRAFSIGSQDITARIDPGFTRPATYSARLTDVRQEIDLPDGKSDVSAARYTVDGTLSGAPSGRISLAYSAAVTDSRASVTGPDGSRFTVGIQEAALRLTVDDLDRAKGERLQRALRNFSGDLKPVGPPGGPPVAPVAPPSKAAQRELVENLDGLLTKLNGIETAEGMHIDMPPIGSVDIGRMLMAVATDTADGRLDSKFDVALDGLSTPLIPADFVPFVPRRVTMRPVLTGLPIDKLLDLMRSATADGSDQAALGRQLDALLSDPNVSAGIDAIGFDSGPLQVTGSARVVQGPNKVFTLQLHLAATGMDALLARAQAQPSLQQILPVLFIAKGMGRQEGPALVWDIVLGDGAAKVNGIPVGQPPGVKR